MSGREKSRRRGKGRDNRVLLVVALEDGQLQVLEALVNAARHLLHVDGARERAVVPRAEQRLLHEHCALVVREDVHKRRDMPVDAALELRVALQMVRREVLRRSRSAGRRVRLVRGEGRGVSD